MVSRRPLCGTTWITTSPPVAPVHGEQSDFDAVSDGSGRRRLSDDQEDFRRRLVVSVGEAVREEQRRLQGEWASRQEEAQRQQCEYYLRSVEKLLAQHTHHVRCAIERELPRLLGERFVGAGGGGGERSVHHGRHSAQQADAIVVGSPLRGASHGTTPQRRSTLQLPADAVRSTPRVASRGDVSDISVERLSTPVHMQYASGSGSESPVGDAPRCEHVAWSQSSMPVIDGDSQIGRSLSKSPGAFAREESENRSDWRSEENERWKHQWKHQMRARLSRRLGGKSDGAFTTTVSGLPVVKHINRHRSRFARSEGPKSRMERLVDGHAFHMCCGTIIVANAVFIGVQMDYSVHNAWDYPPARDPEWIRACSMAFVLAFAAEVVFRISVKGCRFFTGDDWKWNIFDLCLSLCSIVEELLQGFNLSYTRLLRGFRMVRVLRVIRVMRFFRELRLMVCSIIQSLVSLSWALLLLLLIMYLFTICFMHAASEYLHGEGQQSVRSQLKELYGSVGDSMFSLLLAISGGSDWERLVEPLTEISVLYQALFCFYVLFVIICVLNVMTSTFVQRACELSRLDRDLVIQSELASHESFLSEMKGIFEEVDIDGTGKITWQKFMEYLQHEHVQAYFETQQIDTSDARELFNLLDVDENEEVSIEEFVMGCKRLRGQAKSSDVASLLRESRRTSQKTIRAMKRIEAQLGNITHGTPGMVGASWLQPPLNTPSCPRTPASVGGRSRNCTPARGGHGMPTSLSAPNISAV